MVATVLWRIERSKVGSMIASADDEEYIRSDNDVYDCLHCRRARSSSCWPWCGACPALAISGNTFHVLVYVCCRSSTGHGPGNAERRADNADIGPYDEHAEAEVGIEVSS